MSDWWYGRAGKQFGPYSKEILLEHFKRGEVGKADLVWTKGMADWQPLGTVFASELASAASTPPVPPPAGSPSPTSSVPLGGSSAGLPDYGDILCWGIAGILIPCVGLVVGIGLLVLMIMELVEARARVERGELKASDYSNIHPVLMVLGLICCSLIFYPLFMHLRNQAAYFKPQPHAVWFAIVIMAVNLIVAVAFGALNAVMTALQQAGHSGF